MKQIYKLIDINGKIITKEKNIRNFSHFEAQLKYKHKVQSDKKIYNRQKEKRIID